MTDFNNMNREELFTQLNYSEYYRDEMRDTLEKIKTLFNISFDDIPDDLDARNDEHFGDYLFHKLATRHQNNNT
tara:strand:+ start:809 stop:1030 length:222 start_codon:yes stop_codon:yes gene_type:complete